MVGIGLTNTSVDADLLIRFLKTLETENFGNALAWTRPYSSMLSTGDFRGYFTVISWDTAGKRTRCAKKALN